MVRLSSSKIHVLFFAILLLLCAVSCLGQCTAPIPTITINLDMPIVAFNAYELTSGTPANNLVASYQLPAFNASIQTNNFFNAIGQVPVFGYDPVAGNILQFQNGACYKINVQPIYRGIVADIHDDTNLPAQTIKAENYCRNDATTAPQVIAAIDQSFTNSLLFTTMSLTCNAYNITTVTTLYNDLAFANKAYYPYAARASLRLDAPNLLLTDLMVRFGWTRAAVITVTSPDIVNLVTILNQEAAEVGINLNLLFQTQGDVSCAANVDSAIADRRVIFFLGDFNDLFPCIQEVIVQRRLIQQNYIIIFSFSTYSSGGFNMAALAAALNTTQAALQGVFTLTPVLTGSTYGGYFINAMTNAEVPNGLELKPIKYALSPAFLVACDAVTLVSQGVFGMLGNRLKSILPLVAASFVPNATGTPAQNGAALAQAILSALSLTGSVDSASYSFVQRDSMTSIVGGASGVPFAAMRYNSANVFHYFSNATGTSMQATALGRLIHDSNGEALVKIGMFNFDGNVQVQMGFYDMVYSKFVITNTSVVWPNPSLLNTGINNNIPTDRAPTSSITLSCPQCTVPLRSIDPATTVYKDLPMVVTGYELDIQQDNLLVYSIQPTCNGATPVTQTLLPIVSRLSSETDGSLPVFMAAGLGTVSVYSANLVNLLKQMYAASPLGFPLDGHLLPISTWAALNGVSSAGSIVGVVNGADGAFNVEVIINCDNVANNVSAVLRIAIQPMPDVYSPAPAAQDAMIALNSFGLGLTSLLIFAVIKHRDERAIFSSSFMFLLVILVGFLLLFVSSLLSILNATQAICQAKLVTFHMGFTIALGSIFVKNYRLHRIFNSKNLLNMTISNRTLLSAVLSLLLIDTIVVVSWIEISGFDVESSTRAHCFTSGAASNVFPGIFSLLKGLILLSGIYLTFRVRAVPANFNESKFIAFVIYNTAVLSIVYIVVFFAFNIQPNSLAIFTSVITFLGAFVNMVLFYAPKLLALKNLYLKNDSSSGSTRSSRGKQRSKEKERERERDREKEARLGTNNTSTLSQLDPDTIVEEKAGEPPGTARRGSGNNNISSVAEEQPKEKHRTVESVSKRLKGLKGKYLSAVISAKRSNAEHNRLLVRADEVRRLADDFYDELRVLVMDIRLNCERLKKMISTAGSGSEEVQEHLVAVKDLLRLIELPIDHIQCDESTQTYTVMDSARATSRRTQLHMTSVASNVTQVSNTAGNTGNTTTSIQMGNFNTLKREQGSLAKSPVMRSATLPSPSLLTSTISGPLISSSGGPSPSPPLAGTVLSAAANSTNQVIMIERDGIPVPLLPLHQTSSMNQPLSGNDMSVTRSFTPRSGRDTDKGSGTGESLGLAGNGNAGSTSAAAPPTSPVLATGGANGSPVLPANLLGGASARASVRRNVI